MDGPERLQSYDGRSQPAHRREKIRLDRLAEQRFGGVRDNGFYRSQDFRRHPQSKKSVRMGATRAGNTTQLPEMLNRCAGANFEVIPGYTGTSKIRLAMRSREVDGACWTWDSMRSTARALLDANGNDKMIPFIINGKWEDPKVKDIAQFHDVIKGKDNLHAFDTWNAANEFARPFSLPPGSPPEALSVLRKAFRATMEDKDYKADAEKSKLTVDYISGEEVERYVKQIYSASPEVKQRLEGSSRGSRILSDTGNWCCAAAASAPISVLFPAWVAGRRSGSPTPTRCKAHRIRIASAKARWKASWVPERRTIPKKAAR